MPGVKEWVQLEIWTDDEESIGWKILAHHNDTLDLELFRRSLMEMAEWWLDPEETNPVVYSFHMQANGHCCSRPSPKHDFTAMEEFVKLRHTSFVSQWLTVGMEFTPSKARIIWWHLEWMWHKIAGHLERSENAPQPAPATVPDTLTDMLSEQSEVVEKQSRATAGNVLAFRPVKIRDDIRPL